MSGSVIGRVSLSFCVLLLFTGALLVVVTGEKVTVTTPIVNISNSQVDYYWYSSSSKTLLPCIETDVSVKNCTFEIQNIHEYLASLAVLEGKGATLAVFTLNESTKLPQNCTCVSGFNNASSLGNVTIATSSGCPCNGAYLNQFSGPDCNSSGHITQTPSPFASGNVTFTCLIHSFINETNVTYIWSFVNSSRKDEKLRCEEPTYSRNCTVPGKAVYSGTTVQCAAITNRTVVPQCVSTGIMIAAPTTAVYKTTSHHASGAAPWGDDRWLLVCTLLAWRLVGATRL